MDEHVLATICQSTLVRADETGWKEHGRALWLWVFTCTTATLFVVDRRARELVERVLGEHFAGWLLSDGYCAYREYAWHLRCFAHIMRKARGLEQSLDGQATDFGKRAVALLETVMAAVYQAREGPPSEGDLRARLALMLNAFLAASGRHRKDELAPSLQQPFVEPFQLVLDQAFLALPRGD